MTTEHKLRDELIAHAPAEVRDRFWARTYQDDDHILFRDLSEDGYGRFHYKGKNFRANRVVLVWQTGLVDGSLWALHRCKRRDCINPDHLYWGDAKENSRDKLSQWPETDFTLRGVNQKNAKLDDEKVRKIWHEYYFNKRFMGEIARQFEIGRNAVSRIVSGKTWRHVTQFLERGEGPPLMRYRGPRKQSGQAQASALRGELAYRAKINKQQAIEIFKGYYEPSRPTNFIAAMAAKHGVNIATLRALVSRRSWRLETKDLPGGPPYIPNEKELNAVPPVNNRRLLSKEQVLDIWQSYYLRNETGAHIARQHKVSNEVIYGITTRQNYQDITQSLQGARRTAGPFRQTAQFRRFEKVVTARPSPNAKFFNAYKPVRYKICQLSGIKLPVERPPSKADVRKSFYENKRGKKAHRDAILLTAPEALREQFYKNTKTLDGCMLFLGNLSKGYAHYHYLGCNYGAHRVSLIWSTGDYRPGEVCMHLCRNRSCVNPEHLRWGTTAENMAQIEIDHPNRSFARKRSKLSNLSFMFDGIDTFVKDVWQKYFFQNVSAINLARQFNCSPSRIRNIVGGRSHREITKELVKPKAFKAQRSLRSRLTKGQVESIFLQCRAAVKTQWDLACEFGTSESTINHIAQGRTWLNVTKHLHGA